MRLIRKGKQAQDRLSPLSGCEQCTHSHGVRLGVVLILEKERRNFAVEEIGAHEHEHEDDDDDDYVSGTGGAAGEARAAAAGIIGGWAEREREGGRLLPSRSLEKRAISFPFRPRRY